MDFQKKSVIPLSCPGESLSGGTRNLYTRRLPGCSRWHRTSACHVDVLMHPTVHAGTTFMAFRSAGDLICPLRGESIFACNRAERPEIIKYLDPSTTLTWFTRQSKRFIGVWSLLHTRSYLELFLHWGCYSSPTPKTFFQRSPFIRNKNRLRWRALNRSIIESITANQDYYYYYWHSVWPSDLKLFRSDSGFPYKEGQQARTLPGSTSFFIKSPECEERKT